MTFGSFSLMYEKLQVFSMLFASLLLDLFSPLIVVSGDFNIRGSQFGIFGISHPVESYCRWVGTDRNEKITVNEGHVITYVSGSRVVKYVCILFFGGRVYEVVIHVGK